MQRIERVLTSSRGKAEGGGVKGRGKFSSRGRTGATGTLLTRDRDEERKKQKSIVDRESLRIGWRNVRGPGELYFRETTSKTAPTRFSQNSASPRTNIELEDDN